MGTNFKSCSPWVPFQLHHAPPSRSEKKSRGPLGRVGKPPPTWKRGLGRHAKGPVAWEPLSFADTKDSYPSTSGSETSDTQDTQPCSMSPTCPEQSRDLRPAAPRSPDPIPWTFSGSTWALPRGKELQSVEHPRSGGGCQPRPRGPARPQEPPSWNCLKRNATTFGERHSHPTWIRAQFRPQEM